MGVISKFDDLVGKNPQMIEVAKTIKKVAVFNTTVLITGESGTGKEVMAKGLHSMSPRSSKPFIPLNCGAIPENLLETELFGHRKGAFTDAIKDKIGLFEEANGGTILLDEIGELPISMQAKLLRVIQEQEIRPLGSETVIPIDVRIIGATHKDLDEEVYAGRFREDLLFRLNVVSIHLPPLRDRKEDIPILVNKFISKLNKKLNLNILGFSAECHVLLNSYSWPGNIRELENCIERAMVFTDTDIVGIESLPSNLLNQKEVSLSPILSTIDQSNLSIKYHSEQLEKLLISRALQHTGGNRTQAAKLLEISHRALLYKLKDYNIDQ